MAKQSYGGMPTTVREVKGVDDIDGIHREGTEVQKQTEQDRRKLRDQKMQEAKTPEQLAAQKEIFERNANADPFAEKGVLGVAAEGLGNVVNAASNGGATSKADSSIGNSMAEGFNPMTLQENTAPDATNTAIQTTSNTEAPIDATNSQVTEEEKEEIEKNPAVQQAQTGVTSIMDAFANGQIDKNTRDYLIVDTIANFAKNLGKGIQNIGAAYTGGATQDTDSESLWSQEQKKDLEQQQNMKRENVTGSPEWRKAQSELKSLTAQDLNNKVNEIKSKYTDEQLQNMLKIQAQQLGMGDIAQKIANRKLTISDAFAAMSNSSNSDLGKLGYGLLSTLSLDGGSSLMNTGAGIVTSLF